MQYFAESPALAVFCRQITYRFDFCATAIVQLDDKRDVPEVFRDAAGGGHLTGVLLVEVVLQLGVLRGVEQVGRIWNVTHACAEVGLKCIRFDVVTPFVRCDHLYLQNIMHGLYLHVCGGFTFTSLRVFFFFFFFFFFK